MAGSLQLSEKFIAAIVVVGPMINWALYGVLCVQIYVYSYNFRDDRRLLKTLVYFVFLLETVQTALTGSDVYNWVIGLEDLLRVAPWIKEHLFVLIDDMMMDSFISLIVQVFFCYRIWALNKRLLWICIIFVVLSLTQAAGALWSSLTGNIAIDCADSEPSVYLWLVTSALVDILIAVMMTFLLKRRPDNENQSSHFVLARIVRLTIETNTLTSAVAIVSLALYIGFPDHSLYLIPTTVIGKLYSNTLLVTLNNRIYFRDHLSPKGSGASIGPSIHPSHHVPQVSPPPRTAIPDRTIPLDSFSPTTDSDLERAQNNDDHPVLDIRPISSSWGRKMSCYLRMV